MMTMKEAIEMEEAEALEVPLACWQNSRLALSDENAPLYPRLENVREVSRRFAIAIGIEAQRAGLAKETTRKELESRIERKMWTPHYVSFKRVASSTLPREMFHRRSTDPLHCASK